MKTKAPAKTAKKKDTSAKAKKSPKSTSPKSSSLKSELAKNAKIIQDANKKKNVSSATPPNPVVDIEVIPKIAECKDPIHEIRERRVTMDKNGASLTLSPETTPGEYIRLFDSAERNLELGGLILGDLINEGEKLPGFKGKYAAAIASTGRSIDRLKTFASVAKRIPPALRTLSKEIKFEHLRAASKVPAEALKPLLLEVKEAADAGKPMKVAQVKEKANKLAPRPSKPPKASKLKKEPAPKRDMTVEESIQLEELDAHIAESASMISGAAFVLEISTERTITLRENLERIARFSAQLKE